MTLDSRPAAHHAHHANDDRWYNQAKFNLLAHRAHISKVARVGSRRGMAIWNTRRGEAPILHAAKPEQDSCMRICEVEAASPSLVAGCRHEVFCSWRKA